MIVADINYCIYPKIKNINENESLETSMKFLLNNDKFKDISFDVKGTIIKAHKNVIYARCEYFRALLDRWTKEGESITVDESVTPDIFLKFLEFLYAGHTDIQSDEEAIMLLQISSTYTMLSLVKECEQKLLSSVNLENVCAIYQLADHYQTKTLLNYCYEMIVSNHNILSVTLEYDECINKKQRELIEESIKNFYCYD